MSNDNHDPVDHPKHYTSHPSGIEAIQICEAFGFSVGNAIKYLWRAGLKGNAIEDLRKAKWYVEREIGRLEDLRKARWYLDREIDRLSREKNPPSNNT